MSHIHTGENQYDFTTTLYVVRLTKDVPLALLHFHRKQHILLPVGGHVEVNETPWKAVAHELREESGYDLMQMSVLQPSPRIKQLTGVILHPSPLSMNSHNITNDHFHTDLSYAFTTEELPKYSIGDNESDDLRWVTLDEIHSLKSNEIYDNIREVYTFIITTALHEWDRIPAAHFSYNEKTPPL